MELRPRSTIWASRLDSQGAASGHAAATSNPSSAAAAAAAAAAALSTGDPNRITASLFTSSTPKLLDRIRWKPNTVDLYDRIAQVPSIGSSSLRPRCETSSMTSSRTAYARAHAAEMEGVVVRFYLARDPKGLTKFLKSVVCWMIQVKRNKRQRCCCRMWAEPGLDDALELLGTDLQGSSRAIVRRSPARARRRRRALLYLLQLVQALMFEKPATRSAGGLTGSAVGDRDYDARRQPASRHPARSPSNSLYHDPTDEEGSGLADFLIRRGLSNPLLGNNLYGTSRSSARIQRQGHSSRWSNRASWTGSGRFPLGLSGRIR